MVGVVWRRVIGSLARRIVQIGHAHRKIKQLYSASCGIVHSRPILVNEKQKRFPLAEQWPTYRLLYGKSRETFGNSALRKT